VKNVYQAAHSSTVYLVYVSYNSHTKQRTLVCRVHSCWYLLYRAHHSGRAVAQIPRTWIRILFEAWISVGVYSVCVSCMWGRSHVQGSLPAVYRIKELKERPKSLTNGCKTIIIIMTLGSSALLDRRRVVQSLKKFPSFCGNRGDESQASNCFCSVHSVISARLSTFYITLIRPTYCLEMFFEDVMQNKHFMFSRRWLCRMPSSRMWRSVAVIRTDVSEEYNVSIIRLESISNLETM
jgi:hypothetical protein